MKNVRFGWMRVLKGMLTGAAGILPGFSGGVMLLVFGVYEPLMQTLAHPRSGLPKYWKILLPFGGGVALGFLLTARVLAAVFARYELEATCLFVGLVLGMVPALFREALAGTAAPVPAAGDANDCRADACPPNARGRLRGAWIGFGLSFVIFFGLFCFLQQGTQLRVAPNFGWYVFSGVLWGLSLIVPGLSSSSMLLFLGLYLPMTEGLGALNFSVIVPWGIGLVGSVALLSRAVQAVMTRWRTVVQFCIIGVVLASTLPVIPLRYPGVGQAVLCGVLAVAGFLLAMAMSRMESKMDAAPEGGSPAALPCSERPLPGVVCQNRNDHQDKTGDENK